jgi:hypothetical protein
MQLEIQQTNTTKATAVRVPELRYAYYRRCHVFRRNGEQCKAPAEKGSYICHAHAGQLAMAVRREQERRAVLAEAVAEMRRKGRPKFEMADLFMDFKGIQITLAKMAQALIDGRIDCKTAGRLVVQLQMASKLLRLYHRGTQRTATTLTTQDTKKHEGHKTLPRINTDNTDLRGAVEPGSLQVCAKERRLSRKASTTKDTRSTPLSQAQGRSGRATEHEEERQMIWARRHSAANQDEETRMGLMSEVLAFADIRGLAHGPPRSARAA